MPVTADDARPHERKGFWYLIRRVPREFRGQCPPLTAVDGDQRVPTQHLTPVALDPARLPAEEIGEGRQTGRSLLDL